MSKFRLNFEIQTNMPKDYFRKIWSIIEEDFEVFGNYSKKYSKSLECGIPTFKFSYIIVANRVPEYLFKKIRKELNLHYPILFDYYNIILNNVEELGVLLNVKTILNDEEINLVLDKKIKELAKNL